MSCNISEHHRFFSIIEEITRISSFFIIIFLFISNAKNNNPVAASPITRSRTLRRCPHYPAVKPHIKTFQKSFLQGCSSKRMKDLNGLPQMLSSKEIRRNVSNMGSINTDAASLHSHLFGRRKGACQHKAHHTLDWAVSYCNKAYD